MEYLLKDKVYLVTGASRGIGADTAKLLAEQGAFVIINYLHSHEQAKAVEDYCNQTAEGGGWCLSADMTDEQAIAQLVAAIQMEFGRLDGIVCNAAFSYRFDAQKRPYHWEIEWEEYERAEQQTVKPLHVLLQKALPLLTMQPDSRVVVLSSNLVKRPLVTYHTYNVGKATLEAYVQNTANELARLGVRLNLVIPGMVYPTDATKDSQEETKDAVINQTPLGRLATPDDVAQTIFFFLSPYSRFLTGQKLYVDGGLSNQ